MVGVVVKAEKHGSIRCRVLNCSNGSLFLVLCRFSTFLVQRNDPKCHHQDRVTPFALGYIYGQRGSFLWPRGRPSLGWALGPALTLTWASWIYTPHNSPSKSCYPTPRTGGGFWWHLAYVMACHVLSFINAGASSFAWGTFLVVRHSFSLPTPRSCRFGTRGVLSLRSLYEASQIQRLKTTLGIERDLSRLYRLNATRLAPYIRSTVGGHSLYLQTL